MNTTAVASLSLPLPSLSASPVGGEGLPVIQLTPDGRFAARDGRPGNLDKVTAKVWVMDSNAAAAVLQRWQDRATPLVIDYEHQSIHAKDNGRPAPAAGWIESLTYAPGQGLMAAVRWTETATAHIRADEYRYISPTFTFDRNTGAVLELKSAALTNVPALDGMAPVAACETFDPEESMSFEKRLRELLKLPETATESAVETALSEALAHVGQKDGEVPALPDLAQYAPMAALTELQTANEALRKQVEALSATQSATEHDRAIDAALSDGRLGKATEPWARALARSNPEALTGYLRAAAPIAALTTTQTGGVTVPEPQPGVALTEDEKYVCAALDMNEADYVASKKECK